MLLLRRVSLSCAAACAAGLYSTEPAAAVGLRTKSKRVQTKKLRGLKEDLERDLSSKSAKNDRIARILDGEAQYDPRDSAWLKEEAIDEEDKQNLLYHVMTQLGWFNQVDPFNEDRRAPPTVIDAIVEGIYAGYNQQDAAWQLVVHFFTLGVESINKKAEKGQKTLLLDRFQKTAAATGFPVKKFIHGEDSSSDRVQLDKFQKWASFDSRATHFLDKF